MAVLAYRLLGDYSWLEAVWMVVVTISTVGYSEHTTASPTIQLLTILLIVFGVSAAAYTCGGFIQMTLEGEVERVLGRKKMTKEISQLQDHIIICGFGRLGNDLADQLKHRQQEFVVIDIDPAKVAAFRESNQGDRLLAVIGDATDEFVLQEANLKSARAIVTSLPSDAENVFIALTARNLHPDVQIIAKAEQETSCRKLRQAGANKIVMPHKVGAQQMERLISRPTTADLFELFAEASHLDMELDEFLIAPKCDLIGKSLSSSKIKEEFNLLVVGIKDSGDEFRFNPGPSQQLQSGDILLVMGDVIDINRLKAKHG